MGVRIAYRRLMGKFGLEEAERTHRAMDGRAVDVSTMQATLVGGGYTNMVDEEADTKISYLNNIIYGLNAVASSARDRADRLSARISVACGATEKATTVLGFMIMMPVIVVAILAAIIAAPFYGAYLVAEYLSGAVVQWLQNYWLVRGKNKIATERVVAELKTADNKQSVAYYKNLAATYGRKS